jgi:hypothetical protein
MPTAPVGRVDPARGKDILRLFQADPAYAIPVIYARWNKM